MYALFGPLGMPELLIVLFIILLIFGSNRLSGLGRGMGQMIRGFKEETGTDSDEDEAPKRSRS